MPLGKAAGVTPPVAMGSKERVVVAWSAFVSVDNAEGDVVANTKLLCVRKENCELIVGVGADEVAGSEVEVFEPVELALDGKMIGYDDDEDEDVTAGTELPLTEELLAG